MKEKQNQSELLALADRLNDGLNNSDVDRCEFFAPPLSRSEWQSVVSALRATSAPAGDGGEAGERISKLAAELVVSGWMAGDHGVEEAKKKAERRLLEFGCDEISRHMAAHPPAPAVEVREALEKIKRSIDTCLNDVLCEMEPCYDDSITGFNKAWDIVRKAFKDIAALSASPREMESAGCEEERKNKT